MTLAYTISRYDEFEKKLPTIEDYLKIHVYGNQVKILYALLEAVNNALEHGIQTVKDGSITLTIKRVDRELYVEVLHNGKGFDYEAKLSLIGNPDVFFVGHKSSIRGRGIAIMQKLADKLVYSEGGKKLTLLFWLEQVY
ncbi:MULTISPECIES: ATP-binding protein [Niallia]|uniref:ATP-binding protein n=1 Tax=Niallia TaxID=2837506 RepID=UPI001EDA9900|nr:MULTISPECIES: ATP-binding protein [Niallia]MED4037427.1 ATP-binding protein [Niallia taxi]UPO91091.1 ATP-binding protein [Niallia sp. Man26]